MNPIGVLYISYDGMLEPLGASQVLPYLKWLAGRFRVSLLSFEKPSDLRDTAQVRALEAELLRYGIAWVRLRYHKNPPVASTAWDAMRGVMAVLRHSRRRSIQLIHARGYVAALIARGVCRRLRAKFLFDMRGFWADEKVEAGHWSSGSLVYRISKLCERMFLESADGIVTLTREGVRMLSQLGYRIGAGTPVQAITTCTDLARFMPGPKNEGLMERFGLVGRTVIGCSGTMSNWYLRRNMLEALACLARELPQTMILVLTQEPHDAIRREAASAGLPASQLVVIGVPFAEMPAYLRLMDAGLFFIVASFSKKGSAATKLGEFLATGIPVIINDGVGDSGGIVRDCRCGVVLQDASLETVRAALPEIRAVLEDAEMRQRCREAAEAHFDLGAGVLAYAALYESLLALPAATPATKDVQLALAITDGCETESRGGY